MKPFNIDSYIVRIYRREGKNSHRLTGMVERVGVEKKLTFHNLEELWTILSSSKRHFIQYGKDSDNKEDKE